MTVQFACQCQGQWLGKDQNISWKAESKIASLLCDNCGELAKVSLEISYEQERTEEENKEQEVLPNKTAERKFLKKK